MVGYGTAKKRDLTGASTQVKAENLMATAPTNIQEALRGKAAGVMVAGGGLNDTPMIRIRGNRSISASNEPLFVIISKQLFKAINRYRTNLFIAIAAIAAVI